MSVPSVIPFLDLVTPHVELESELTGVFHQALRTAGFIGGAMVEEFEKAFAEWQGSKYAISVATGTAALHVAMTSLGTSDRYSSTSNQTTLFGIFIATPAFPRSPCDHSVGNSSPISR